MKQRHASTNLHWDMLPRALAEGPRLRVVSVAAGRHGIRAGMSVPEARGSCASLDVRTWDDNAIADAILAVTTALLAASPQVTPVNGAPGTWWVGASGFMHIGGEEALGCALLEIACRWHPDARVAIADSCVAARAATWAPKARRKNITRKQREKNSTSVTSLPDGLTCIPAGCCASYLAPAPLGLVPMEAEIKDALQALGIRTIGMFAALDAGDIEKRWGAQGLTAWRLSHGDDPRRPGLIRTETSRVAGVELPAPAEGTAPILFVLRALLERLVGELVNDARAAASVAVTLVLDAGRQWPLGDEDEETPSVSPPRPAFPSLLSVPHRTITREVRPARPIARVDPLFDQCRSMLERWTIPAPVIGVSVSIPATAPLAADQGDLLVPSWRDAAMNADAVFTRLRTVLDPDGASDVVVHPVAGDAHRPEEAARWEPADAMILGAIKPPSTTRTSTPSTSTPTTSHSTRPTSIPIMCSADALPAVLRMLPKPEDVEVEETNGLPDAVWWRGRRMSFDSIEGPERISGDWWRVDSFARDYWCATVPGEGQLLLYCEVSKGGGGTPDWYMQGWYD